MDYVHLKSWKSYGSFHKHLKQDTGSEDYKHLSVVIFPLKPILNINGVNAQVQSNLLVCGVTGVTHLHGNEMLLTIVSLNPH